MLFNSNQRAQQISRSAMLAAGLLFSAPVFAQATFLIWPIYPKIEANEKATAVWLENTGKTDAMVQIRVYQWDQQNFSDQYKEQTDIIPSPPVTKIKAGEKHMLRLTKTANIADQKEAAYRVLVDELPIKLNDQDSSADSKVSFQMRYSIPLFVYGKGLGSGLNEATQKLNRNNKQAKPILTWSIKTDSDGKSALYLKNSGQKFSRLSGLKLSPTSAQLGLGELAFGYVLAGRSMKYELDEKVLQQMAQQTVLYGMDSSGVQAELIRIEKEQ